MNLPPVVAQNCENKRMASTPQLASTRYSTSDYTVSRIQPVNSMEYRTVLWIPGRGC